MQHNVHRDFAVALRKESVDRNLTTLGGSGVGSVALRKESVDRNLLFPVVAGFLTTVALRKESVDRNCPTCQWRRSVKCRSPQGERG